MFQRVFDEITKWLPWTPTMHVVMLGTEYNTAEDDARNAFLDDFRSRLQLTYRKGFSTPLTLLGGKEISSDAGWGCMLRVIQMILAQSFVDFTLGREWRFQETRDLEEGSAWLSIVSCFLDTPKAPFSLHCLVDAGQKLFGKEPSTWFGPTSSAKAVGSLFDAVAKREQSPDVPTFVHRLGCAVFEDGAIIKSTVLEKFESGCEAVILLVCRRLGLDSFNMAYRDGIEACFSFQQFLGLASGNSGSSAHYFVATHGDCLCFLDPHQTYPALETLENVQGGGLQASRPHALRWTHLNPSVCLGFLVRSPDDFAALCSRLCEGCCGEVFEVFEKPLVYSDHTEEVDGDMVLFG